MANCLHDSELIFDPCQISIFYQFGLVQTFYLCAAFPWNTISFIVYNNLITATYISVAFYNLQSSFSALSQLPIVLSYIVLHEAGLHKERTKNLGPDPVLTVPNYSTVCALTSWNLFSSLQNGQEKDQVRVCTKNAS